MPITDLTGYTWTLNTTLSASSSVANDYYLNYSVTCYNSTLDNSFVLSNGSILTLAYTNEYCPPADMSLPVSYLSINTSDYDNFGGLFYQANGRIFESTYGSPDVMYNTSNYSSTTFVTDITFTGGSDANNSTLISWLEANGTLTAPEPQPTIINSSFNSFKLNNNVLTFNGVDYTLDGTATITDTNNSSFKSIFAVDNGDDTITLNINSNEIVVNKYIDPNNWTFGVSGLTGSTPALTRTDDSANFTWSKNASTGLITTDFDTYFNFERVTHGGSTFVRIPKMYFKRTADTIQLSNTAQEGFSVHPCFLDESGNENDYYDVGCYKAYNDNNVMKSVSGVSPTGSVSLTNWRTYARANNTGSDRQYFVEDIRYLSLLWMLWCVVFATRQTEDVMGTTWYSYSGATTGNTDSLVNNALTYPMSICGQDPTTHSFKFFGIEDVVSAGREWIDGVAFVDTTIKFSLKPSEYVSDTFTNYTDLSYARPSTNGNITAMGLDSNHPAIMYPSATDGSTTYTTYYCDREYYGGGTVALYFGADFFNAAYGVFYCNGSYVFSSAYGDFRSRLCSQPL